MGHFGPVHFEFIEALLEGIGKKVVLHLPLLSIRDPMIGLPLVPLLGSGHASPASSRGKEVEEIGEVSTLLNAFSTPKSKYNDNQPHSMAVICVKVIQS